MGLSFTLFIKKIYDCSVIQQIMKSILCMIAKFIKQKSLIGFYWF